MLKKRNQKGFTLIEIIAVLVILGILAAVAIPKYFDMQTAAQEKAVSGALAALQSTVTMTYANRLLAGDTASAAATAAVSSAVNSMNVGDYQGNSSQTAGVVTVTVQNGPAGWSSATTKTKTFNLY
jgi:prepilin-type N-terminal cleavage/methylation domain-containing protein